MNMKNKHRIFTFHSKALCETQFCTKTLCLAERSPKYTDYASFNLKRIRHAAAEQVVLVAKVTIFMISWPILQIL